MIDNYPKVEFLPNFLNAKYDYENKDKIDWNDLVIFNEWIRQDNQITLTILMKIVSTEWIGLVIIVSKHGYFCWMDHLYQ